MTKAPSPTGRQQPESGLVSRILAALLAAVALASATVMADVRPLSGRDIHDAIVLGSSGPVAPYPLRMIDYNGKGRAVVGVVYTPFVRVAFAARASWLAGRRLGADAIRRELLLPEIYVAFRANAGPPVDSPSEYRLLQPGDVVMPMERHEHNIRLTTPPIWVSKDPGVFARFGAPVPFDDLALVAAFPLSALSSGHDFAIVRNFKPQNGSTVGQQYSAGRVTAAELAEWR